MDKIICARLLVNFYGLNHSSRLVYLFEKKPEELSWKDYLGGKLPDWLVDLEKGDRLYERMRDHVEALHCCGINFCVYGDEDYPKQFYAMIDPPLFIGYRGQQTWKNSKLISVVGSREPNELSLMWLENHFVPVLQQLNLTTVSGGARGIDQKAHGLSLRYRQPTIAVLPSGLLNMYPSTMSDWQDEIIEFGGCILSEYSEQQRMRKDLFRHRNRLIAALSPVTFIVEAKMKSGTLMTANIAAQQGRVVFVVPGHPMMPSFSGNNLLLSEGATMIRDANDLSSTLLAEFGLFTSEKLPLDGEVMITY